MNYLTPEVPPFLEKYYSKFDNIFKEQSQRDEFRLYGTGLLLEIKRKNIQYISKHIIDSKYQSMHHFMHDSPYDEKALNDQRIDMLQNNRSTKSCNCGYIIIDDTGNPKSGDSTFATRRQWIGCIGKVDRGQVVVTSHYTDSNKDWAIDHRPYLPEKWVQEANARQNKEVYTFKSKLELGLELIDDIIKYSLFPSFDRWLNSPDFIKGVEERNCKYITALYANRRVFFHLVGEPARNEHYMRDIVIALEDDAFCEVGYTKANGDSCIVYVADMIIKVKGLGKRRILIVKPSKSEKNLDEIEVLMTNDSDSDSNSDFKSEASFLLHSWSFRDRIDKFYERGKDDLGFDQYQVRDEKPINRHWYMVFLMDSFLIWHRQCGSFGKWCVKICHTFGELLDVVRTKLMIHFQKWCIDNPEHWSDFLLKEKGVKVAPLRA
jgi:hypothetical protein